MIDERSTEEILKVHPKWSYIRIDRNGTRYFSDSTCQRCGGHGFIQCYGHIDGGRCFECGGSGIGEKAETIKVYTKAHADKLDADRKKREQARKEARLKDYREHMSDKLKDYGFGIEDGTAVCYRVVGNTYEIKDTLKSIGCKFNPCLGWYSATPLNEYEVQRMLAADVIHFNEETISLEWSEVDEVKPLWIENIRKVEESPSAHVGNIGDKITVELHIDRAIKSEYSHGYWDRGSYLYLMHDADGNQYKWSSSCYYEEGEDVKFKATIKDHSEYNGIKQTVLTRCTKVKE